MTYRRNGYCKYPWIVSNSLEVDSETNNIFWNMMPSKQTILNIYHGWGFKLKLKWLGFSDVLVVITRTKSTETAGPHGFNLR